MEAKGVLVPRVLWLLLWVQLCRGAAELRLEAGGSRCAGRVEVKHQGFVQLAGGDSPCSGRVEIRDGGQWRTVCDSHFDLKAAKVICRELQLQACSGRVEMQVQATWGTLCDSRWDFSDAHVLCHQLNCGFAESVPGGGHFGRGTGPVWRESFHCEGTESHLGQCPVTALGASPCSHDNDAGVFCSGPLGSLRLVDGGSRCDGRVEMALHGAWGRVLDDEWDVNDASVVCRQLQCGEAERAYNPPKPEGGTGPVELRRVQCGGKEARLTLCNISLPEAAPAGTAEDVGVVCSGSRRVRLVNGTGRCAGRVEIYYQGTWGTICNNSWDLSDATVVCHQLDCGVAVEVVSSARYGEGSGQIWLDDVNCSGDEAALWDCPAATWGQHNCPHKKDAGVVCSEFVALRLENSNGCSGRLQVFYNGTWGSVCSNSMTLTTVSLVCKELGCGDEGSIERVQQYGKVSGPTWLDHVECGKRNSSFWQCPSSPWNPQSCDDQQEETHITCNGNAGATWAQSSQQCPWSLECDNRSRRVRLVNGTGCCAGRVEIYYQGTWGTICNDSWDLSDATVVCHQLDCGVAVEVVGSARYGQGSGQIWLDDVNCSGDEAALWDCPAATWGQHNCPHKKDAGVVCSEFVALRLENSNGCSGRLQVFYNGTWGSVCSNSMTLDTVSLVCKELGCGDEGSIERVQQYGKVSGPTWLDRVECGKRNSSFWQCPSSPWNPQSCDDQQEETHITCNDLPRGHEKDSRRISVPVIICIILGALLCLILALLVGQVRSARAQRRGSRRSLESFSEAVYQEIDYSLTWEKQAKFGRSGSSSEGSLTKLQPDPGDSEEEDGAGSAPDVPTLPRGDPADDYDDAKEVSEPREDFVPGQQDWEAPREAEEGDGPREAQRVLKVQRKQMPNSSSLNEFLLLMFADAWELQLLHFLLFLGIYLAALMGNGLIITAIAFDHHLHTPVEPRRCRIVVLHLGLHTPTLTLPPERALS
ncbi:antigen WC1.1-like [Apteryx mantelli]|uniref:Antigen WC1.1-like n=1 Tax=Apteryx mantelli TaxID=2696672 RepID=A0ABM4FMG2_9AVES